MAETKSFSIKSVGNTLLKPFIWVIENPTIKLLILMGLILSVFIGIGTIAYLLQASITGIFISAGIGAAINILIYAFSHKIVPLIMGARNVNNDSNYADIREMLEELTAEANKLNPKLKMSVPQLYFSDDRANAFATGRNPKNSIVCVTSGLLKLFDRKKPEDREALKAILAHEISHIRHKDMFFMTSVAVVMGIMESVSKVAYFQARANLMAPKDKKSDKANNTGANLMMFLGTLILSTFITPVAKVLGTCFLSRTREYGADRGAFELMQDSKPMIRALRKLQSHVQNPLRFEIKKDSSKIHQFDGVRAMCISPDENIESSPKKKGNIFIRFIKWLASEGLATHPTFDNRVKALEQLEKAKGESTRSSTSSSGQEEITVAPQQGRPLYYGYRPADVGYPVGTSDDIPCPLGVPSGRPY